MHTEQDRREWLAKTTNSDNLHAISVKTGLSVTALRHRNNTGMTLSAEQVIAIARAYNQNPIDALIACGFIPPMDGTHGVTLEQATNRQLLDEIEKRMK